MQIFVDADACPVVKIVEKIAQKYEIKVNLLCGPVSRFSTK